MVEDFYIKMVKDKIMNDLIDVIFRIVVSEAEVGNVLLAINHEAVDEVPWAVAVYSSFEVEFEFAPFLIRHVLVDVFVCSRYHFCNLEFDQFCRMNFHFDNFMLLSDLFIGHFVVNFGTIIVHIFLVFYWFWFWRVHILLSGGLSL